jgi:hypothetical protein
MSVLDSSNNSEYIKCECWVQVGEKETYNVKKTVFFFSFQWQNMH